MNNYMLVVNGFRASEFYTCILLTCAGNTDRSDEYVQPSKINPSKCSELVNLP